MTHPTPIVPANHVEPPHSIVSIPIHIELPELPGSVEDIQEVVEEVVNGIRSAQGVPPITQSEAEEMARQIEAALKKAIADRQLDEHMLKTISAAISPVRKAIKSLVHVYRGGKHAG